MWQEAPVNWKLPLHTQVIQQHQVTDINGPL